MTHRKFIERLLGDAKIEWMTLGDVIKLEKGRQLNKELLSEHGLYPAFNGGTSHSGFTDTFNYAENTTIVSQGGASAGFVNFVTSKFYANAHCYVVLPNTELVENRYVYHLLKLNQKKLISMQHGAGIPALRNSEILKILAPIPCPEDPNKSLEIQSNIVRILDKFNELTSELTSELTARKEQYNYYRNKMLSFEESGVKWMELGDVGEILRGTAITEKEACPGKFPVVANGPTQNYYHNKCNRTGETIVIARSGAYAGLVSYWNQPIFLTDAFSIHPDNKLLITKFLYHFLKKDQTKLHLMGKGAGVPHVRARDFESYKIPIPCFEEQTRIVARLDKFDALTNSVREGLPLEIDLRHKQYEYYRDFLLSFPKPQDIAV